MAAVSRLLLVLVGIDRRGFFFRIYSTYTLKKRFHVEKKYEKSISWHESG